MLLFPIAGQSQDLTARLDEVSRLIQSTEYRKAVTEAEKIVELAKRSNDINTLAEAYFQLGDASYYLGDLDLMKSSTEQSLKYFRKANDLAGIARCYYQFSFYYERSEPQEMLRQLEIAKKYADQAKDPSSQTVIENALGIAYENLGQFRAAVVHFEASAKLAESAKHSHRLAIALSNVGQNYAALGDYQKAMPYLDRAFSIGKRTGDKKALSVVLAHRGGIYLTLGNADAALSCFLECLALHEESGYKKGQVIQLRDIADVYDWLGDTEAYKSYARRALVITEEIHDNFGLIALLNELAETLVDEGRFDEAESYLQRARTLAVAINDANLLGSTAYSHAMLQLRKNSFAAAEEDLNTAEHYYSLVEDPYSVAFVWSRRGRVFELQNKNLEAIDAYRRAVALHESTHTIRNLPSWCSRIAQLNAAAGNQQAAQEYFEKSLLYVNQLDSLLVMDRFRLNLFSEVSEIYNGYSLWLASQNQPQRAWEVLEQGRARTLRFRMAQALENTTLTNEERDWLGQLTSLQRSLREEELSREERDDVLKKISVAEAKYEQASFHAAQGRPRMKEEESIRFPAPSVMVIEYAIDQDDLLIFSKDQAGIRFRKVSRAQSLLSKARDFQEESADYARPSQSNTLARSLFTLLLQPELKEYKGSRLILIPDSGLWSLPFAALEDAEGKRVAENYSLSIVPSVETLTRLQQRQFSLHQGAIAFANSSFPDTQKSPVPLASLPGAAKEAEMFAKRIRGSRVMMESSEANAKRMDFSRFNIVHFATHTLVDETHPERSCIVLGADSAEDGYLQVREIYRMKIPAEMIVLSGCRSGSGTTVAGEGLIGLSHALFAAGGRTIVSSLWEVSDEGTLQFMNSFYDALKDHSVADALQDAQISLMHSRQWNHPGYWSGFVAMGDADETLRVTWASPVWRTWAPAVILAVLLIAAYIHRRRSRRTAQV